MSKLTTGYYESKKGNEGFEILRKSSKVKQFYTKGSARSDDNDFDKHTMLVCIYEIIGKRAYILIADRKYRLPYALSVKVKDLEKLELTFLGRIPAGWRGRDTIDTLIEEDDTKRSN